MRYLSEKVGRKYHIYKSYIFGIKIRVKGVEFNNKMQVKNYIKKNTM